MLPDRLSRVITLLSRLPGVGEKTAQRYALHFVTRGDELASELGRELLALTDSIRTCDRCGNLAEHQALGPTICRICRDSRRDQNLLCVVAKVQDLLAIERSSVMRGQYFVLGQLLSPLEGAGPESLPLERLRQRIQELGAREIIIATPSSVEGEATALYLAQELASAQLTVSRIASGIPHGGDLEYTDQITLGRAIAGRRMLDEPR